MTNSVSPTKVWGSSISYSRMTTSFTSTCVVVPGHYGNLLVRASEVDAAPARVNRAYEGLSIDAAIRSAMPFISHSNEESDLRALVTLLPDGLGRAQLLRSCFLTLAPALTVAWTGVAIWRLVRRQ